MNAFTRACAPLLVLCVTAATAEAQGATQQASTMVFPAVTVIDSTAHPPFRGATVGLVVIGLKESRNASQAPVVVRYDRSAASASVGGCLDAGSAIRMTLEENLTIPR